MSLDKHTCIHAYGHTHIATHAHDIAIQYAHIRYIRNYRVYDWLLLSPLKALISFVTKMKIDTHILIVLDSTPLI